MVDLIIPDHPAFRHGWMSQLIVKKVTSPLPALTVDPISINRIKAGISPNPYHPYGVYAHLHLPYNHFTPSEFRVIHSRYNPEGMVGL